MSVAGVEKATAGWGAGLHPALGFSSVISNMEAAYAGSLETEKLLQCPYDKTHQIRAFRFPYHLIKS